MEEGYSRESISFPFIVSEDYHENYVILIDILGFSEFVKTAPFHQVYSIFSPLQKRICDGNICITTTPKELEKAQCGEQWTGSKGFTPALTVMSDTIVICVPEDAFSKPPQEVHPGSQNAQMRRLYNMIIFMISGIVSEIQISLLKVGLLSRGAITYGKVYYKDKVWFGPAMIEAHEIEKKAKFPRVILSNALQEKFLPHAHPDNCLEQDGDEVFFIDYLKGWFTSEFAQEYPQALQQILTLAETKISNSSQTEDEKKNKWQWLKEKTESKIVLSNSLMRSENGGF